MARLSVPSGRSAVRRSRPAPPVRINIRLNLLANWVGAAFVLATAAFSLYLTQVISVATAGYDLERLQTERAGWVARNEQLQLELAKRHSLAWSETQAVERLGMVKAGAPVFVVTDAPIGSARPPLPPARADPEPAPPASDDGRRLPAALNAWLAYISSWLEAVGAPAR